MRVLLSTYDSRGGVEPLVGLAVRLRELGAEVRVCAPPDCTERPEVTDNRVLNDLNAQSFNALFGEALNTHRAAVGLPSVDNVRDYVFTGHPWLAADPALTPKTRARATAVAGAIRTDGATVAATLLFDAVSRERPPVFA
jgi:hypothetical protein